MRNVKRVMVAVLLTAGMLAVGPLTGEGAAAEPTVVRLATGAASGGPGTDDPLVLVSEDDKTFRPAVLVDTAGKPYDELPGSHWVSVSATGNGAPDRSVRYRVPFTLPAGFQSPSLSISVHADNAAAFQLNGTAIGGQPDVDVLSNFQDPAEVFTTGNGSLFKAGDNVLDVIVRNGGDPSGLDLVAELSYQPAGSGGGGSGSDESTVSVGAATMTEGDEGEPSVSIPVTISPALRAPATVRFASSPGTALAGADFTATSGTLNLDNGQSAAVISVPVNPDLLLERDETFTVTLDAPVGVVIGQATAVVTIVDDDPLELELADTTGSEGGAITVPIRFSSPALDPGSVRVTSTNGTAAAPEDFVVFANQLVSWNAGATSASVAIQPVDDSIAEGPESLSLQLSDPTGASVLVDTATVTIADNDVAGPKPMLSVGDVSTPEGDPGAPQSLRFPVTLGAPTNFAVSYRCRTVEGGTGRLGLDYTAVDTTATIAPGTRTSVCVVPIRPDPMDEPDRTVRVEVSSTEASVARGRAEGTIEDDDPHIYNIGVVDAAAVKEGDPGGTATALAFRLTMTPAQKVPVSVGYVAVSGNPPAQVVQDFLATGGRATFAAGQTSLTVNVPVVADVRGEQSELVLLRLSNAESPQLPRGVIGRPEARGAITDDDPLSVIARVDDAGTVLEGDPGTPGTLVFPIRISPVQKSSVTLQYTAIAPSGGTPASTADFVATSGRLTVPAGVTSMSISVPLVGDLRGEAEERVELLISDLRTNGAPSASISQRTGRGFITNDDPTALNVGIADAPKVAEGDPGSGGKLVFPVTLSPAQKEVTTVRYTASVPTGGTPVSADDFVATSGQLTIPAGVTSVNITVPIVGDLNDEPDERINVRLSDLRNSGAPSPVIGHATAQSFIINDDPPAARWRIDDATVAEGSPTSPGGLRFKVSISPAQKRAVGVNVVTEGATAQANADFTPINTRVSIPAGQLETFVEVPVRGDVDVEPHETLFALLQNADGEIADGRAGGVIMNDDSPPGVSISDARASEGTSADGALTFAVTLAFPVATQVSVDFAIVLPVDAGVTQATADDLTSISGTLVFAPGETKRLITVHARADAVVEPDQTFTVRLLNPVGVQLADRDGVGTIVNDDGKVLPPQG